MNQLKTKIEEAKQKLGLTQMELSERLGKNPYYLDTVKHRGVSTVRQMDLIGELDLVMNGGTVMTERELIGSLSEQLASAQDTNQQLNAEYKELDEAYGRACEKLVDMRKQVVELKDKLDANSNFYKSVIVALVVILVLAGLVVAL